MARNTKKVNRIAIDLDGKEVAIKGTNYDLAKIKEFYNAAVPEFHDPRGNSKTGEIQAFNVLPVMTCSGAACATCAKEGCYAVKNLFRGGYNYETNFVAKAWADNTKLAKEDLAKLEKHLDAYFTIMGMSISSCKFFRIHSSGDFFSVEYAAMWYRLAAKHTSIKFLAFTKQFDNVRPVHFYELDNFSLVLSAWTGVEVPEDLAALYPVAYCVEEGGAIPENAIECPGDCDHCGVCWNLKKIGKNTYFHKH